MSCGSQLVKATSASVVNLLDFINVFTFLTERVMNVLLFLFFSFLGVGVLGGPWPSWARPS